MSVPALVALPITFVLQFASALPTTFVMPSIRFLASLPNEDGLYAALERWRLQMRILSLSSGNEANTSRCATLFRDCGLQFSIEQSNATLAATKQHARTRDVVLFATLRLFYVLETRFPVITTISARRFRNV